MKFKIVALSLTVFLVGALVPIALADEGDGTVNAFCGDLEGRRHPVGGRIAGVYDVPYFQVMGWFCEQHYGFGEILLALQTSQITGVDPGELLLSKTRLGGWGEVWAELGFTGKPKAGTPPSVGNKDADGEGKLHGPPAWAGPKKWDEDKDGSGPPPWAGPKNKPWKNNP